MVIKIIGYIIFGIAVVFIILVLLWGILSFTNLIIQELILPALDQLKDLKKNNPSKS